MTWRDATVYSRGERGTVEPRIWELDLAGLRVSVHRYHGCDGWFVSCYPMRVDREPLAAESADSAKNEALFCLRGRAKRWLAKLGAAVEEIGGAK